MKKLMDTFADMVKAMFSNIQSEMTGTNYIRAEETTHSASEALVVDLRPVEHQQATQQVAGSRPTNRSASRGEREARRGATVFYRNSGQQRRPTYAEALGNHHQHTNSHTSRRPITFEERIRTSRQPWVRSHQEVRRPREVENTPTDAGVQSLGKLLFQNCQLKQSRRNWKRLPKSINNQLDKVFDNIKPPQESQELGEALERISECCKNDLTKTILDHIGKQSQILMEKILEYPEETFDTAARWARRRTLDHFGRRVVEGEVNGWLQEDCSMVTRKWKGERPLSKGGVTAVESANASTSLRGEVTRSSQKRGRAEDRSSPEQSNRFTPLLELEEDENTVAALSATRNTPKKPRIRKGPADTPEALNLRSMDLEDVDVLEAIRAVEDVQPIIFNKMVSEDVISSKAVIRDGRVACESFDVNEVEQAEILVDDVTEYIVVPETAEITEEEQSVGLGIAINKDVSLKDTPNMGIIAGNEAGEGEVEEEVETPEEVRPSTSNLLALSQPSGVPRGILRVHGTVKKLWRLPPSAAGKTVVIMDDNVIAKRTHEIDPEWEFHSFPKANFEDIIKLMENLDSTNRPRRLVSAVGWHNKSRLISGIRKLINQINSAARKINMEFYFHGLLDQPGHPDCAGIKEINDFAHKKFGVDNYIYADECSVDDKNRYDVDMLQYVINGQFESNVRAYWEPSDE